MNRLPRALSLFCLALVAALVPASSASAATITVDTTVDNFGVGQDCSLREAVWASNNDMDIDGCVTGSGADTIVLGVSQTYLLTMGDAFFDPIANNPETGDLDVTEDEELDPALTIEGNGSIVDASGLEHFAGVPAPDRIFQIHGVSVVINSLTMQGGGGIFDLIEGGTQTGEIVPEGGGILVEPGGSAQLNSSTVRANTAQEGGGIYNDRGHVELHGSLVGDRDGRDGGNVATSEGGGIYTVAEPIGNGEMTLIVDGSSIDGNIAIEHGGGIYNGLEMEEELAGDRVEVIGGSTVSGNLAGGECLEQPSEGEATGGGNGGGIWTSAEAQDSDSETPGVDPDSRGVFIDASTIADNEALSCGENSDGNGAGIYSTLGHVEITGGSLVGPDNTAASQGGGIWTAGGLTLVMQDSTVDGNTAGTDGGGIYNSFDQVTLERSTVSNNTAEDGDGGGVWTQGFLTFSATNSTISGNAAEDIPVPNGGGEGGGIYLSNGSFVLHNVTIARNGADVSGGNIGIGNLLQNSAFIDNTIVAEGVPDNCAMDSTGTVESLGFNLSDLAQDGDPVSLNSCQFDNGSDLVGRSALLGPLQGNGGPTETHAIPPQSPAVDSVPTPCPVPIDQRGVTRPQDGDGDGIEPCDRGAFELETLVREGGEPVPPPVPPVDQCEILGTAGPDILIGTDANEDLCGLQGDDTIRGGGGNDNLFGNEGDDRLNGGPGDDALVGGGGNDTGDYSDAPGSVDASLTRGTAVGVGASTDGLFELENLIGSPFADVLTGDNGPNQLRGKAGADRILGLGGEDLIRGALDSDVGKGGGGADLLKGGKHRDRLRGGGQNDTITGGQKNDDLRGNAGDDDLKGGGGGDSLNGNAGNDSCGGGSGTDTLVSCES
jgi:CSLREA domain-containing protein